jgi:hypothetical protein
MRKIYFKGVLQSDASEKVLNAWILDEVRAIVNSEPEPPVVNLYMTELTEDIGAQRLYETERANAQAQSFYEAYTKDLSEEVMPRWEDRPKGTQDVWERIAEIAKRIARKEK